MKNLLLSVIFIALASTVAAQECNDLFFSEYIEGSANNKALEIYNPTNNAIDLGLYTIKRYSNGSPFPTEELTLSGTIQPKDVVVVTNGQTDSIWVANGGYWSLPISEALYGKGDLHCSGVYPTPFYFNGDDAMTLETITGGVIDIFGKIGQQPENGWNDIPPSYVAGTQFWTSWSEDQTLIRKRTVKAGVSENPALFMVNSEWDSIPEDTFDSLGFHRCDCGVLGIGDHDQVYPSLLIYPNPAIGNILSISASQDWLKAEVLTLNGQMVRTVNRMGSGRGETDLFGLPQGVYILKVTFEDDLFIMEKLIRR